MKEVQALMQQKVPAVVGIVCLLTDRKYLGPIGEWKNISRYERKRFKSVDKTKSTSFTVGGLEAALATPDAIHRRLANLPPICYRSTEISWKIRYFGK